MLTVIPANVDVATQEIIELATEADPSGERTLGVFTMPDLVDRGAEPAVVSILNGHSRVMKLGWYIIRNPVGIESLRCRLKDILSSLIKKEFPKVKTEIRSRVTDARRLLASLGPERESSPDQMAYLTGIATEYQRLVSFALCANHGAHEAFEKRPSLRLAPAIVARMKAFSEDMATYGAKYAFKTKMPEGWKNLPLTMLEDEENIGVAEVSLEGGRRFDSRVIDDHEDLVDIVSPVQSLPLPRSDGIHTWLKQVFQGNPGFELGTFNPSILSTTMKKQCSKWRDVSLGFVGDVITLVHRFIEAALDATCPDRAVRQCLGSKLSEELLARYQTAIARSKFLLEVEHSDIPITMNHYFNDNLQRCRQDNHNSKLKSMAFHNGSHGMVVRLERAMKTLHNMVNEEYAIEDIHHILCAYYNVRRKAFVDSICKQATVYCLLTCEDSLLALLSPVYISRLSVDVLQQLAGEVSTVQSPLAILDSTSDVVQT
ncbi:dynamin GTPase [Hortaea werneckii]|nr:dynamin GTPase [Hortaea werneckii]